MPVAGLLTKFLDTDLETALSPVKSATVLFGLSPATISGKGPRKSCSLMPWITGLLNLILDVDPEGRVLWTGSCSLATVLIVQRLYRRYAHCCPWRQVCWTQSHSILKWLFTSVPAPLKHDLGVSCLSRDPQMDISACAPETGMSSKIVDHEVTL
jgi:hypothetical protein